VIQPLWEKIKSLVDNVRLSARINSSAEFISVDTSQACAHDLKDFNSITKTILNKRTNQKVQTGLGQTEMRNYVDPIEQIIFSA
jgi:hypothetical protein